MNKLNPFGSIVAASAVIAFAGGCSLGSTDATPPQDLQYADAGATDIVTTTGYVWDPEAFFYLLATCDDGSGGCPVPPITVPTIPIMERSLVAGADVALFDPAIPGPGYISPTPTGADGVWDFEHVAMRPPDLPLFMDAAPDQAGASTSPYGPPFLQPVPPGNYLPTFNLRPIFTDKTTDCIALSAGLMTDEGPVGAVADYLTFNGQATTVGDLMTPPITAGTVVWWNYAPGSPALRVPATNTRTDASEGTPYLIAWAPPGYGPPWQTARGYFVDDTDTTSPLGLTVIVLPPMQGPPHPVTFTPVDPSTAPGHPLMFPPIPPMVASPGEISFSEFPATVPTAPPPADFVCLE